MEDAACVIYLLSVADVDGNPVNCQSQLLAQISEGAQSREVFGYYFSLGAPSNEPISNRLARFLDKRRIQNTARHFLEHLFLHNDLLMNVVLGQGGDGHETRRQLGPSMLACMLPFHYSYI